MKKRITALMLSMAMLCSVSMPVHAEEVSSIWSEETVQYYLQHDGYSFEGDNLYYKGLLLNRDGLYETTDSNGEVCYLDPSDPEFDRYVLGEDEDETNALRQDAANATTTTGLDGVAYPAPTSLDGKTVHKGGCFQLAGRHQLATVEGCRRRVRNYPCVLS